MKYQIGDKVKLVYPGFEEQGEIVNTFRLDTDKFMSILELEVAVRDQKKTPYGYLVTWPNNKTNPWSEIELEAAL